MEIIKKHYPDEDHVFIFDNATTHIKRADGLLSALKMPKGPSESFGVEVNDVSEDGRLTYTPDGKALKKKVHMSEGKLPNGDEQDFYFPMDSEHEHAGKFKGMAIILEEQGYVYAKKMKAQCGKKFLDCGPGAVDFCCRQTLFNQPDFVNVKSLLETEVRLPGPLFAEVPL